MLVHAIVTLACVCLQEDILKKLQSSVESEEKRWIQKLKHSEDELQQVRQFNIYYNGNPICCFQLL